jgi:hypothetical protein
MELCQPDAVGIAANMQRLGTAKSKGNVDGEVHGAYLYVSVLMCVPARVFGEYRLFSAIFPDRILADDWLGADAVGSRERD